MTCGLNSRTSAVSGTAAMSRGWTAKQPSGSGDGGSPSGSPESTKPRNRCCTPRISRARLISSRRIVPMSDRTSGRSIAGFRMSPRSPPVSVATSTWTPSATYAAIVAAPLLDSSSGWACTASSRSGPSLPDALTDTVSDQDSPDNQTSPDDAVPSAVQFARAVHAGQFALILHAGSPALAPYGPGRTRTRGQHYGGGTTFPGVNAAATSKKGPDSGQIGH